MRGPIAILAAIGVGAAALLGAASVATAQSKPDKILRVKSTGDVTADVFYERELSFRPSLANIEKACGGVTRPPGEVVVQFVKNGGKWALAPQAQ